MTWEQKPKPDPNENTWTEPGFSLRHRAIIRKARIGWHWVDQRKTFGTWADSPYGTHWRPTRRLAECAARNHARKFTTIGSDTVISLNPDDLR